MKIYFEDGELREDIQIPVIDFVLSANSGVTENFNALYKYMDDSKNREITIYTNSIFAFSNRFAWNEKLKAPEVYIRNKNDEFIRIDRLTTRELRQGHNLAKLYVAGEFDIEVLNVLPEGDEYFKIAQEYYTKYLTSLDKKEIDENDIKAVRENEDLKIALENIDKAINLDKKNPFYFILRNFILNSMGYSNEALSDSFKASGLKLDLES